MALLTAPISTFVSSTIIAPNSPPTYQAPLRAKAGVASKVDESATAMASFRIIFPFLLRPNGNDLELNTVSGVSAQARLSPHLLPKNLSLWSTKDEAPRPTNPQTSAGRAWFHAGNKKVQASGQCDIYAAKRRLIAAPVGTGFWFRHKHLAAQGLGGATLLPYGHNRRPGGVRGTGGSRPPPRPSDGFASIGPAQARANFSRAGRAVRAGPVRRAAGFAETAPEQHGIPAGRKAAAAPLRPARS